MDHSPKMREIARFAGRVATPNERGCALWTASVTTKGYGRFKFRGEMHAAHRIAWVFAHGPIPTGLCVLHKCDNPPCVNVEHLFLGTIADNNRDRDEKGRARGGANRGSRNPQAKLHESDIPWVRAFVRSGHKQRVVADAFGITQTAVSAIARGVIWGGV